MGKNIGLWDDEEVKTLFKFVEVKKSEGLPLIKIFDNYAKLTKRQQNSVRNYYYMEILNLTKDKDRAVRLGINLYNHKAKNVQPFSVTDTQNLIQDINELINQGYSVRGACLKLSGGDASEMIRLQNKYRMETKYKKEAKMGTIIKMPEKKNIISDEEINALFLGLIKLVRRQEREKNKEYQNLEMGANDKLKEALANIVIKNHEIEKLQEQLKLLKKENEQIKETAYIQKSTKVNQKQSVDAKNAIKQFVKAKKVKLNMAEEK